MTTRQETFAVYCAGEQIESPDGTPIGMTYIYATTPLGQVRMTAEEADELGRKLIAAAEYDRSLDDEDHIDAPANSLTVIVDNHRPAPQGSKRHIGRGRLLEQSERVAPWRAAVDQATRRAVAEARLAGPLDGPLSVEVAFTVRKPASAPKRRLTWPTTRDSGDIDKLLRSTFDALTTGGAVADDSRIVEVTARKVHPGEGLDALEAPGAVIRIWRLDEAVAR